MESWLSHTISAAFGGLLTGIPAAFGVYYFVRTRMMDLRTKDAVTHTAEVKEQVAQDQAVAVEVKKLADWQVEVFKRRYEDLERQMVEVRAEMRKMHDEHMACLTRSAIQDGKIQALQDEVARLRGKGPMEEVTKVLDHIEAEATLTRAENIKQTELLSTIAGTPPEEKKP